MVWFKRPARARRSRLSSSSSGTHSCTNATPLIDVARSALKVTRAAVADLGRALGEETVAAIAADYGEATFWPLDVSTEPEIEQVTTAVVEKYGSLTTFVNCAGVIGPSPRVIDGGLGLRAVGHRRHRTGGW